jgi:hypothetical protein
LAFASAEATESPESKKIAKAQEVKAKLEKIRKNPAYANS